MTTCSLAWPTLQPGNAASRSSPPQDRDRAALDENLSEAALARLSVSFPGSTHVRRVLGTGASDRVIWDHARDHGLVLVTRDEDFERLSTLHGAPPKVIWLAIHNPTSAEIVAVIEAAHDRITRFVADATSAMLVLRP